MTSTTITGPRTARSTAPAPGESGDTGAARSPIQELSTRAPVLGVVSDSFEHRLDPTNTWRLPTVAADVGAVGPFWIAGASLTGLGHRHRGKTGQDSICLAASDDGSLVAVAVADGLGSRPDTSQIGAAIASRLLSRELSRLSADEVFEPVARDSILEDLVDDVSHQMVALAADVCPTWGPRDLATTVAVAVLPNDRNDDRVVVLRIGDCSAFGLREGQFEPLFDRDDGPINIVEAALPCDAGRPSVQVSQVRDVEFDHGALVLVTDGLSGDIYDSPSVRAWLADRWSGPTGVMWFLDSLRYRRRGCHDDRTALVVWRAATEEEACRQPSHPSPDKSASWEAAAEHLRAGGREDRPIASARRARVWPWSWARSARNDGA